MATARRQHSTVPRSIPNTVEALHQETVTEWLGPLFQYAPEAILVLDAEGHCIAANPAAADLLGYACEELQLLRIDELATSGPGWTAPELALLSKDGAWRGEVAMSAKDGGNLLIEASIVAMPHESGSRYVLFLRDLTERKAREAAAARLAALVRSSPDAIMTVSRAGIITDWNAAAEQLFGWRAEDAIGNPVAMLAAADNQIPNVEIDLARLFADETISAFETVRRMSDGTSFDVAVTTAPIYDEAGQALGALGIIRDISERKRAEQALQQSEERFRQAFEHAVIGMAVVALDGRYLQVNSGLCALTGYDEVELLRKTYFEITHPDDPGADEDLDRRLLAGEIPAYQMEKRYLRRDGNTVWVRLSVAVIRDAQGIPLHFIEQFEDVTTRTRAAEALRASEERYRALFELAPVMYVLVREVADELVIVEANSLFVTTLGYTADEIIGRPLLDFYTPEARKAFLEQGGNQRPLRQKISGQERQLQTRNGRVVEVLVSSWPEQSANGAGTRAAFVDITQRRRAEVALRQSEERFRTPFTHAAIGMAVVDLDGRFLQVNRALCELTGYSEPELLARTFQDITHPDDLEADLELARRLVAGEIDSLYIEKRYLRKDGGITWIHLSGTLVRDERGAPLHTIAQIEDITARKEAEAALAQERDMLQILMNQLPDAIYVKDATSRFLRLNPPTARILGIADPAEALGKTDFDFFPEPLAERYFADEQQVMATGEPLLNRLEPQGENAEAPWWLTSRVPLRDATGEIIGVVGSVRDISDLLRVEGALRQSEARQRALLAALPDLVFRLDRSGTYLDYKADQLGDLATSPDDFLGRTVSETLPADLAVTIMAAIEHVLNRGGIETIEYELDVLAGHQAFEARLVAASSDEVVAVVRNVTDRKIADEQMRAAKEAAEEASRLKSAFLSTMSHELRTPLTAITGYTELLLLAGGLSPDQAIDIAQIAQSADHLLALVGDVLDLSRLEVGISDLRLEQVDLAAVVDEALAQLAPRAASRDLRLTRDVPAHLVVGADRRRLRQIVLNLASNAVKFTESGEIRVTAAVTDGSIELSVSDTGIGIQPAVLPHIFEEFRQAESGVVRRYEGAGLGLAIAKKLAEQQGGHISVTSEPGHGSTFTLHLPAAPAPG